MPDILSSHDHESGPTKPDTPARQAAVDHINDLKRNGKHLEAMRVHEVYISGKPGTYTRGTDEEGKIKKFDEVPEKATFFKNGQWSLEKDSFDPKYAPKDRKIKELQQQIDSGTYKPDASKIAEKIIQRSNNKIKKEDVENI